MEQVVTRDEEAIRELADQWSKALEAKDLEGLTADYAPDALLFDVKPPYKTKGVDAIRRLWEVCLPYFPAKYKSVHRDFEVTVSGDLAFAHGLHQIKPTSEDHPAGGMWLRVTVCYQRRGGKWQVVHEHVSLPFDPATGQVSYITEP